MATFDPIVLQQVFTQMSATLETINKSTKQLAINVQGLGKAFDSIDTNQSIRDLVWMNEIQDEVSSSTKSMTDTLKTAFNQAGGNAKAASGSFDNLSIRVTKVKDALVKLVEQNEFLSGIVDTVKFMGASFKGVWGVIKSLTGGLFMMAKSIISIPFQMLSSLVKEADAGGGGNELAAAYEKVREEFGSFKEATSRDVIASARSMKGELANTGLSIYKTFGGLAQRLDYFRELAQAMGATFGVLSRQFAENAEAIGAYQKGLGLSNEAMKAIGARAFATGTQLTESLREVGNYALQMGQSFGISSKLISKDIGEMMVDFKHFGGLGVKEMANLSVYARRLGIDMKGVLGVVDKFDNFEDAAQGAAQLSQAFGLNVDAIKLMNAQNPAERVEMLRKSFFAAGRSIENMTRQERRLLASQTGLDDAVLDQVFSLKNQALSYDQVTKKSDAAKKSQLNQTQVLKQLSDNIQRLTQSGSSGMGGFFERFLQGFAKGIRRSQEFRELMRNLRIDLRATMQAGMQVGRMFVDMFPGVKDILGGLRDIFNPRAFKNMLNGVVGSFRAFFTAMTTNPQTALPKLLESLKKNFFDFFNTRSSAGQKVVQGYKKFFTAIADIAKSGLKLAFDSLKKGFNYLTALMKGEVSVGSIGDTGGFVGKAIHAIVGFFEGTGGTEMLEAAGTMFKTLFHKLVEKLPGIIGPAVPSMAAALFGPATARALIAAALPLVMKGIGGAITSGGGGLIKGLFQKARGVDQAASTVSRTAGNAQPPAALGAQQSQALTKGMSNWEKFGVSTAVKVGLVLVAVATALAVGGVELALAIRAMSAILEGLSTSSILKSVAVLGAMSLIMIPLGLIAKTMGDLNPGKTLKNFAVLSAMLLALGGVSAVIFSMMGQLDEKKISMGTKAIMGMSVLMLAMVPLALAGVLVAKIPQGEVVKGLGMMGLVLAGLAVVSAGILALLSLIPESKLNAAAGAMEKMNVVMLSTIPVIAAASLIGLAISASGGIAAGVIAVGLAAMVTAMGSIAVAIVGIMRTIDAVPITSGFNKKVEGFTAIMKGLSDFTSVFGQIMNSIRPSLVEVLRGETMSANIERFRQFITNLIGSKDSGLMGLISSITRTIGDIPMSDLQKMAPFTAVLAGVADLMKTMQGPLSEINSGSGIIGSIMGSDIPLNLSHIATFADTIKDSTRGLIRSLLTLMSEVQDPDKIAKLAQPFAAVMQGVGAIMKAVQLSGDSLKNLQSTEARAGLVLIGSSVRHGIDTGAITAMGQYAGALIRAVSSSGLFDQIRAMMIGIVQGTQGITEQQINALKVAGPIMQAAMTGVSAIATIFNGALSKLGDEPLDQGKINMVQRLMGVFSDTLGSIMTRMGTAILSISTALRTAFGNMTPSELEGMTKKVSIIKDVFGIISTVSEAFRSFQGNSEQPPQLGDITRIFTGVTSLVTGLFTNNRERLQQVFATLNDNSLFGNIKNIGPRLNLIKTLFETLKIVPDILNSFSGGSGGNISMEQLSAKIGTVITSLQTMIDPSRLNPVFANINGLQGVEQGATKLKAIAASFKSVKEAMDGFKQIMESNEGNTTAIQSTLVENVGTRITAMVNKVREINESLNSLSRERINVNPALRAVARNLGLSGNSTFNIDRANIQMNIQVNVSIDARELERVLIERPNSRFATQR